MCVEFCQNVSESCLKSRPGDTLANMGNTRLWASPVRCSCFLQSPQVAVQCTSSCGRDGGVTESELECSVRFLRCSYIAATSSLFFLVLSNILCKHDTTCLFIHVRMDICFISSKAAVTSCHSGYSIMARAVSVLADDAKPLS